MLMSVVSCGIFEGRQPVRDKVTSSSASQAVTSFVSSQDYLLTQLCGAGSITGNTSDLTALVQLVSC